MNKKHLAMSTLLAALLSVAGASSFAQDRYYGGDRSHRDDRGDSRRGDGQYSQRDHDRGERRMDDRNERRDDGYHARGGGRYGDEGSGGERRWDGAGPYHDIRRGGHLPARYRSHQYVVTNWREHNLRPPPRGYHWVQTGGDYVLAAVATGIIADLIINH